MWGLRGENWITGTEEQGEERIVIVRFTADRYFGSRHCLQKLFYHCVDSACAGSYNDM